MSRAVVFIYYLTAAGGCAWSKLLIGIKHLICLRVGDGSVQREHAWCQTTPIKNIGYVPDPNVVITMPADDPAPVSAEPSAGILLITNLDFCSHCAWSKALIGIKHSICFKGGWRKRAKGARHVCQVTYVAWWDFDINPQLLFERHRI